MHWFDAFETRHFEVNGASIFARVSPGLAADRPVLLLLHGFPQTHVMWHRLPSSCTRILSGHAGPARLWRLQQSARSAGP